VQHYLERGYVVAKPITAQGLTSELYAAMPTDRSTTAYLADFVEIMRTVSVQTLPGVVLL
jgi:LysR family transcriptional regulator for metE and metH